MGRIYLVIIIVFPSSNRKTRRSHFRAGECVSKKALPLELCEGDAGIFTHKPVTFRKTLESKIYSGLWKYVCLCICVQGVCMCVLIQALCVTYEFVTVALRASSERVCVGVCL